MGGDLPSITPWVAHRRAPVSVRHVCRMLDYEGSCLYRALTDTIGVVDVDIKEGWQQFARASPITDHDHRVADSYDGRSSCGHFAIRVEYRLEKADDPGDIMRKHSWNDGRPAIRLQAARFRSAVGHLA